VLWLYVVLYLVLGVIFGSVGYIAHNRFGLYFVQNGDWSEAELLMYSMFWPVAIFLSVVYLAALVVEPLMGYWSGFLDGIGRKDDE
jgi:hypothetical protein